MTRNRPIAPGSSRPHQPGADREVVLEGRRGVGLDRLEQVLGPEPHEELGLGRRPEVGQAGRGRGPLDGRHVDVRGQVLAPDMAIRVGVDAMAEVGPERAVAAADRVVQLGRRVAVVDQEEDAASEPAGGLGQPRIDGQRDLGPLALGQGHLLGREALGERGRRRVGLDIGEGPVAPNRP